MAAPAAAPSAHVDPLLLEQALTNVIENAIRHTAPSTSIKVGCSYDEDNVMLWVEDDGPGVSTAELPRIFDKFYQGRAGNAAQGAGLGLAIRKGFVEAMRGAVHAESPARNGRGLRVSFAFERQKAAAA
jgi:two-component system sensor histidine kinase KdpD